ncbi:MAG: hypothetical protein IIT64_06140, partial [Bacteroidaceae bacterium]|nr:hypothetical protein [Bacteroidaceae bacterium]
EEDVQKDTYSKKAFGIPSDAFTISVIGNRLDSEVDDEFESVMKTISLTRMHIKSYHPIVIMGKAKRQIFLT